MPSITFQPQLRPALPLVNGPKEYREQRALFIRLDEAGLQAINAKLIALLNNDDASVELGLAKSISFDNIYFDSTCLKAPIHFPVDWVLLRDATRTLMKATLIIRRQGLRHRMPQEPLAFLSDMNTLCMKMSAKYRTKDGRKHRKKVLREMKRISKRIASHARKHLKILNQRGKETELTPGQIKQISKRIENVLDQLPAAIKQAHERIIGGRKLANKEKILSFYDPDVQVIKRGKSNAEIEFGNNLWLGETREGLKRRAGTEARVSIIIRNFMGAPARAKGFKHREMMVGWAVLSHNLWVLARLDQANSPKEVGQDVRDAA